MDEDKTQVNEKNMWRIYMKYCREKLYRGYVNHSPIKPVLTFWKPGRISKWDPYNHSVIQRIKMYSVYLYKQIGDHKYLKDSLIVLHSSHLCQQYLAFFCNFHSHSGLQNDLIILIFL